MYYKENAWWVSPYNDLEEVRKEAGSDHDVVIHDATLRDGEQTPGVVFSPEDKLKIAEKLVEAGVTRIEAGMPAVSGDDFKAVQMISSRFPQAEVFAFARAMRGDIDMAREAGCRGVVIEIPIGYPKLVHQFGWTWEKVLEKSIDCISYAKEQGLYTVYFPYDTTRAREEDLENLLKGLMASCPPDSVGLVDTMGCALPQTIRYMVRWMKKLTGNLPVEVHAHNDFGMAVANELAGMAAGAGVLHGCVCGMGERTGNAAVEELVMAMNILMGMDTPYRLDKLGELCSTAERLSGLPCALNKPFVGARNYTRESGIGVDLVVKEPLAMFATDPRFFGREAEIVLGKKSGRASVNYALEKLGAEATDGQAAEILSLVKVRGTEKKGLLTMEEFGRIVEDVTKGGSRS